MEVLLRPDIRFVAVIAQISILFLQSAHNVARRVRRGVVRDENFDEIVIADLLERTCKRLGKTFAAVVGDDSIMSAKAALFVAPRRSLPAPSRP